MRRETNGRYHFASRLTWKGKNFHLKVLLGSVLEEMSGSARHLSFWRVGVDTSIERVVIDDVTWKRQSEARFAPFKMTS